MQEMPAFKIANGDIKCKPNNTKAGRSKAKKPIRLQKHKILNDVIPLEQMC